MLGFDGLSKSNYIRQLPQSKKQMEEMGFILMEKHAKIADNTFPNWVGIFMGQHAYDYVSLDVLLFSSTLLFLGIQRNC